MGGVFAAFGREVRKRSKAEGIALGKAQGIALGKEQGIEQSKRAFVRSMLANGCSQEEIVRLTSLSLAEVQTLAQQREKTDEPS